MSNSITVAVRIRPLTVRESSQLAQVDGPNLHSDASLSTPIIKMAKGIKRIIQPVDDRVLIFDPAEENPLLKVQRSVVGIKRVKDIRYAFDKVLAEDTTQEEVYLSTAQPLIDGVLDGYNATVFAYGATGCGKTHTVTGTPEQPGVISSTMKDLFDRKNNTQDTKLIEISISYLEIYNETIRDLLVQKDPSTKPLLLREDANRVTIPGLSVHHPQQVSEVMEMLMMGNANRTTSPTLANETSSRSHAILQINVIQKSRTADVTEDHTVATLSIIDLAGSERASVTKNRGDRLLEGANINRSLLSLGNCINALCDPHRRNHVPYRDSKLTRLLKFSLGGNCKTVMIVCVSPASIHYDESHNTLKYANRAKEIKTKVTRNLITVDRHVSQYVKAIYELRQENAEYKKKLESASNDAVSKYTEGVEKEKSLVETSIRSLYTTADQCSAFHTQQLELVAQLHDVDESLCRTNAWLKACDLALQSNVNISDHAELKPLKHRAENLFNDLRITQSNLQKSIHTSLFEQRVSNAVNGLVKQLRMKSVPEDSIQRLTIESDLILERAQTDVLQARIQAAESRQGHLDNLTQNLSSMAFGYISDLRADSCDGTQMLSATNLEEMFMNILSNILPDASTETQSGNRTKLFTESTSIILENKPLRHLIAASPSPAKSPKTFKVRSNRRAVGFKKTPTKKKVRWNDMPNSEKKNTPKFHIDMPEPLSSDLSASSADPEKSPSRSTNATRNPLMSKLVRKSLPSTNADFSELKSQLLHMRPSPLRRSSPEYSGDQEESFGTSSSEDAEQSPLAEASINVNSMNNIKAARRTSQAPLRTKSIKASPKTRKSKTVEEVKAASPFANRRKTFNGTGPVRVSNPLRADRGELGGSLNGRKPHWK